MTSQSLPVSYFCTPPEVKFDAFGTSKQGEGNFFCYTYQYIGGDLIEQIKKFCHTHFKVQEHTSRAVVTVLCQACCKVRYFKTAWLWLTGQGSAPLVARKSVVKLCYKGSITNMGNHGSRDCSILHFPYLSCFVWRGCVIIYLLCCWLKAKWAISHTNISFAVFPNVCHKHMQVRMTVQRTTFFFHVSGYRSCRAGCIVRSMR